MGNVCAYLPVEYQKKATEQKRCLYFHIFSSISKGVFSCKRGDDLPEIIKTKDQTNEFFRSFYQNYFQGNVFVWIFLFAGKFSCEDFTGGCNFLYGIKKHFFTFRYVIITKVNGPSFIWKKRRRSIETNFKIGCAPPHPVMYFCSVYGCCIRARNNQWTLVSLLYRELKRFNYHNAKGTAWVLD